MKGFEVIISPSAEGDILESFIWGCGEWGVEQAEKWAGELRHAIAELHMFPLRCPVAPESELVGIEFRQLIVGRYRVLFYVVGKEVRVTHVRGAFAGRDNSKSKII